MAENPSSASSLASGANSGDSASKSGGSNARVHVHVYNLENNSEESATAVPSATSAASPGVIKIKERLANQWHHEKKEETSGRDTPILKAASRGPSLVEEQAATPGSYLPLGRSASNPASHSSSPSTPQSIYSHSCPLRSIPTPYASSPASLRVSTLRSSDSSPSLPSVPALRRMNAFSPGLSDNTRKEENNQSSKSLKRELGEESQHQQSHKKSCLSCTCSASPSATTEPRSVPVKPSAELCPTCNLPSASSPKSNKLVKSLSSPEPLTKSSTKNDDIQIPVISSSTLVSSSSSCKSNDSFDHRKHSSLTNLRQGIAKPPKHKKSTPKFCTRDNKIKRLGKKCLSDSRRTRSGHLMENSSKIETENSPSEIIPSASISDASWSSDGENNAIPTRTSGRHSGQLSASDSNISCPSSRVLKSVNRGTGPLKITKGESASKVLKYLKSNKKKKSSTAMAQVLHRSLSSPAGVDSPQSVLQQSKAKKASKMMLLRSDKPMITRSQEKTSKSSSSRPK